MSDDTEDLSGRLLVGRKSDAGRRDHRGAREGAVFRLDEGLKVYLHRHVFSNRRRNRVRILGWDRNGFWLLLKRLAQDRFIWPIIEAAPALTVEQLHWLLEGNCFRRVGYIGHRIRPVVCAVMY